jgi:transposase-like protein
MMWRVNSTDVADDGCRLLWPSAFAHDQAGVQVLRTTNPIESTFATVRHRTIRSRGCISNKAALAMIFKLAQAAEKSWDRLRGHNQLPKIILGVTFNDRIEVVKSQAQAAAA